MGPVFISFIFIRGLPLEERRALLGDIAGFQGVTDAYLLFDGLNDDFYEHVGLVKVTSPVMANAVRTRLRAIDRIHYVGNNNFRL